VDGLVFVDFFDYLLVFELGERLTLVQIVEHSQDVFADSVQSILKDDFLVQLLPLCVDNRLELHPVYRVGNSVFKIDCHCCAHAFFDSALFDYTLTFRTGFFPIVLYQVTPPPLSLRSSSLPSGDRSRHEEVGHH
jgi:hypothetical protein